MINLYIYLKSKFKYFLNYDHQREKVLINSLSSRFKHIGINFNIYYNSILKGVEYMTIGDNFECQSHSWIECVYFRCKEYYDPNLIIGNNCSMQFACHIGCADRIEIGDNVLLGSKVYITDHFHGNISSDDIGVPPSQRPLSSKPVKIGNNVWIGDNAVIMPGVTLGDNVIVGANAVVTHNFPANSVIAGVPAKIIKTL